MRKFLLPFVVVWALIAQAAVPVKVEPVSAVHGMVVAAHPEAAAIGVAVLRAGGNAIDAAVATALAVGVAEPYGSGLGGKLMLLYYEAKSGRTFAVDAMDACGSAIDLDAYRALPDDTHSYGYTAVCVPGLGAGLWAAHEKWGAKKWADDVAPAIALARNGFLVLPKSHDFFEEQEKKLRRGDAELARWYLPGGKLPEPGTRLANADLAHTLELFAAHGRDGFYRGPVAAAVVAASQAQGGALTLADFARYEPRISEPVTADYRGWHLVSAPPPATGPALLLTTLKVLEADDLGGGPLRTPDNLDRLGRAWRVVAPLVARQIADVSEARFNFEKLVAPDSVAAIRAAAFAPAAVAPKKVAAVRTDAAAVAFDEPYYESEMAATTQWMIVDAEGNVACCTQSLSLHFGAGVVAPGTGVVLNDSMSNFSFTDPRSINFVAAGKRSRSTICPTLGFREGKPVFAAGIPGAARIPTALLQALLDRIVLDRPWADAIGDTRIHFAMPVQKGDEETIEAESSLPESDAAALRARGWKVVLAEAPGRGRHFGGINVIEIGRDGTRTGYADPRRTNAAVGY